MAPPDDDHDVDRAAILRRRAVFVTSAIAGLSVAAACSDGIPAPCLEMAPVASDHTSSEPSATATVAPPEASASSPTPQASTSASSNVAPSASSATPSAKPQPTLPPPSPCLRMAAPPPATAPPKACLNF